MSGSVGGCGSPRPLLSYGGEMTFRKVDLAVVLAICIPLTFAGPAVAKPRPKPPGPKAPKVLTGSVTGSDTWANGGGSSGSDRWTVKGLKLKRGPTEFRKTGWRRVYKIIDGTVTWTHQATGPCGTSFKETFSLKGVHWDEDSRVTYFVSTKGRFKNRWFIDASIYLPRERALPQCAVGGETAFATLPALFLGLRVNERHRAVPGKKAKLTWNRHYSAPDSSGDIISDDATSTLTINAG
jgi:hypothetical protein